MHYMPDSAYAGQLQYDQLRYLMSYLLTYLLTYVAGTSRADMRLARVSEVARNVCIIDDRG